MRWRRPTGLELEATFVGLLMLHATASFVLGAISQVKGWLR